MTDEQVRAEFEAWATIEGFDLSNDVGGPGDYYNESTAAAWQAWQAARLAGLREAAKIAKRHEAGYVRTATAILVAAGDET